MGGGGYFKTAETNGCSGWSSGTTDNNIYTKSEGVKKMEAYCFKCRSKREIKDPAQVTLKNGRPATQGVCPQCNTKVFRIGKA